MPSETMTPNHPRWVEFYCHLAESLEQKCRKRRRQCNHTTDTSIEILNSMGMDVDTSLAYFAEHGGYCDCEVLMNVAQSQDAAIFQTREVKAL